MVLEVQSINVSAYQTRRDPALELAVREGTEGETWH